MATALEVRDALIATLDSVDAQVYKTAYSRVVSPAVVVGPGSPWVVIDYAMGPTELSREWRWEVTPLVQQTDAAVAFENLADLVEAIEEALLADADLGGVVRYAVVQQVSIPQDVQVAEATLLGCSMLVRAVSA